MNRLVLFALFAVAILAAVGSLAKIAWQHFSQPDIVATAAGPKPSPVETAIAERRLIADKVEAIGTTRAHEAVGIRPLRGGRLIALKFQPGDHVKKGDVLASLDFESEQAAVAEEKANLLDAQRALNRAVSLRRTQAVSQAQVDELEARQNATKARLEAAIKELDERTIVAPFDGIVGFNEFDVGARLSDGDLLTTLDDSSTIRIVFQVPERYYGRVRVGQSVYATSPAFPGRVFEALITNIDTRVAEQTRAFRIWASYENSDGHLPAGLTMNVDIVLDERQALMVPEEAVLAEASGSVIFALKTREDGTVHAVRTPVKTGHRTADSVEILEGIEEGQLIVRLGLQDLHDGMAVSILSGPRPSSSSE